MAAFDLIGTDVFSVLLGGRISRNGTTVKCYRDGMQVFRGAYRVVGVFFDGERHYWEELEWEGSLVRQLDSLAAEAESIVRKTRPLSKLFFMNGLRK